MLKFLDQRRLGAAVKGLAREEGELRIAVAFWGDGALQQLGIRGGGSLKVICNLLSGATNPKPIRDLLKRKVRVKSNPRLHAKVYASQTKVAIGSSNASSNGLAIEGHPLAGWLEANVLSNDPKLVGDVHRWFDDLWMDEASANVTPALLEWAEILWKSRPKRPPGWGARQSLIQAYRAAPNAFDNVWIAVYDSGLSEEAKKAHREHGRAIVDEGTLSDQPKFIHTLPFENFELPDRAQIIDVSVRNRKKPRLTGYIRKIDVEVALPEEGVLQLGRSQRGIVFDGYPKPLRLSPNEVRALYTVLPRFLPKKPGFGGRLLPLGKVLRAIR